MEHPHKKSGLPELWEPVYPNLVEVIFSSNSKDWSILTDQVLGVQQNVMTFNLNAIDGIIKPLDILSRNLNKDRTVYFNYHDKSGKVISRLKLVNFRFTKFLNLLDFNYADPNPDLKKIQVEFIYEKIKFE